MYKDWGKNFYPPELKKGRLEYLAREFDTVEINSSFYHLPNESTFQKWKKETPPDFVFAAKLSRFITHQSKLDSGRLPIRRFLKNARGLGDKLAVILIQLPPFLKFDEKVFKNFLKDLKAAVRYTGFHPRFAFEPRHESWMEAGDKVRAMLRQENISLVFPHSGKIPSFSPEDANLCADFVYVRFHGPSEFAASRYGPRKLKPWAARILRWYKRGLLVFVYFNNDINGHAIEDARALKRLLKE